MTMKINNELVRKLRIGRSWTQEKLADASGLNLRTIQRIETDGVASLQSCAAMAQALEVEPLALLDNPDMEPVAVIDGLQLARVMRAMLVSLCSLITWAAWQLMVETFDMNSPFSGAVSFLLLFFAACALLTFLTPFSRHRWPVVVGLCFLALLLTPPSLIAQMMLMLAMWAIFELSVVLFRRFSQQDFPSSQ